MLDFEIFNTALRHCFRQFIGIEELTSDRLDTLPDKFHSVTARMDISGEAPGVIWLNVAHPGIRIAMEKLNIPNSDEDRMMMDAAGELLNIIVGSAQRNSRVRYEFSLPSAFKGDGYPLRFAEKATIVARRFIFEEFEVILILEQ
jgi:hypothetical protein